MYCTIHNSLNQWNSFRCIILLWFDEERIQLNIINHREISAGKMRVPLNLHVKKSEHILRDALANEGLLVTTSSPFLSVFESADSLTTVSESELCTVTSAVSCVFSIVTCSAEKVVKESKATLMNAGP